MVVSKKAIGKRNRRDEILQAAEKLMRSRGLSGVTTREISRKVGCSDAALYVHFKGRLELLLAMLEDILPAMLGPLGALKGQVGRGLPQENLEKALRGIFRFHQRATPIVAGLFAEPELHAAYRASLVRKDAGPHRSLKIIEEYIAAEQALSRIDRKIDAHMSANVMMASSFFRAFSEEFFGVPMAPIWSKFVKQIVSTVAPPPTS
jgi:AcrR family transcriptional regulator